MSAKTFAYGANDLGGGCECPALSAGIEPGSDGHEHPGILRAAERYDSILQNKEGSYEGEVPEEVAKDAWIHMLQEFDEQGIYAQHVAEEVAAYHDWI